MQSVGFCSVINQRCSLALAPGLACLRINLAINAALLIQYKKLLHSRQTKGAAKLGKYSSDSSSTLAASISTQVAALIIGTDSYYI